MTIRKIEAGEGLSRSAGKQFQVWYNTMNNNQAINHDPRHPRDTLPAIVRPPAFHDSSELQGLSLNISRPPTKVTPFPRRARDGHRDIRSTNQIIRKDIDALWQGQQRRHGVTKNKKNNGEKMGPSQLPLGRARPTYNADVAFKINFRFSTAASAAAQRPQPVVRAAGGSRSSAFGGSINSRDSGPNNPAMHATTPVCRAISRAGPDLITIAKLGLNVAERPVLVCPRSRSVAAPVKPASRDDLAAITAATLMAELSDESAHRRQQRYQQLGRDVAFKLRNDLWGAFD
eukprot:m.407546 g.407546  ORF g.407546 m.407546 type:complete len:288 (-) comp28446_c1_seq1:37-900(-)